MERQNKSLDTQNSYVPETSVGHLQLVFALMQFGKQRSVDPEDFIKTLRINTSLQQDAHVCFLFINSGLFFNEILNTNSMILYWILGVFKFIPISFGKQILFTN